MHVQTSSTFTRNEPSFFTFSQTESEIREIAFCISKCWIADARKMRKHEYKMLASCIVVQVVLKLSQRQLKNYLKQRSLIVAKRNNREESTAEKERVKAKFLSVEQSPALTYSVYTQLASRQRYDVAGTPVQTSLNADTARFLAPLRKKGSYERKDNIFSGVQRKFRTTGDSKY